MNSLTKDTYVKHNLGKVLSFWLLLTLSFLAAEDLSYTFHADTNTPYVKEPVILNIDLNQTNHNIVLLLDFDLKKSDAYTFQRLDAKEMDAHHDTKVLYTYIVYPLKAGEIPIHFKLTKKVTTDSSVAYSFSGDRDNVRDMVTVNSEVTLPPVVLKVKPLPKAVDFVGDFTLRQSFKKHHAKAYEPLPFQIEIKGKGYTPLIENIIPKTLDVTLFKEKPLVKTVHSHSGSQTSVIYPMAFSSKKSFDLPEVKLQAFNPKTKKLYTLNIPAQHFDVEKEESTALLDKKDSPKPFNTDWSWLSTLLSYLLVFAAGYLSAVSFKLRKKQPQRRKNILQEKIASAKDEKALFQILMASDNKKFAPLIDQLESALYKNAKINFKDVKAMAEKEAE